MKPIEPFDRAGIGTVWMLFLAAAVVLPIGCGRSGPQRYDISGTVVYDGKPVPAGRVIFEPDQTKGNRGPASYAIIEDGRYTTSAGKGTVGGPVTVRIMGRDGIPTSESPHGSMLFPEYRTTLDLPEENTTEDFQIPRVGR